jgi:hypothetical protein
VSKFAALLLVATLFGGMVLDCFGFAPLVFGACRRTMPAASFERRYPGAICS